MICCEKCFKDAEIISIIRKSVKRKGDCGVCANTNVYIYDTDIHNELVSSFNSLLDIYTTAESLPEDFPNKYLTTLEYELKNKWNIFTETEGVGIKLVSAICSEKYERNPKLFEGNIGIYNLHEARYLEQNSLLKTYNWKDFVDEIIKSNRFHTNIMNVEVFEDFCKSTAVPLGEGLHFYRARISDENGFNKWRMGAPPADKVKDGRANPIGIQCLYLSENKETTLHEIRAGAYDYVTIGIFKAKSNLSVVDFTILDQTSPFLVEDVKRYATNKEHLISISQEIAKPLRSIDSPLDYLPSQYIVEYIKSKGFNGVKYNSTISETGFNLAIFDESLFDCVDTQVFKVESIEYDYSAIDS